MKLVISSLMAVAFATPALAEAPFPVPVGPPDLCRQACTQEIGSCVGDVTGALKACIVPVRSGEEAQVCTEAARLGVEGCFAVVQECIAACEAD